MQSVYLQCIPLALVVQPLDNTIHLTYIYPRDNAIGFPNTYLVDSVIQCLNNWGLGRVVQSWVKDNPGLVWDLNSDLKA